MGLVDNGSLMRARGARPALGLPHSIRRRLPSERPFDSEF
jgi:hypothetical protein